MYEIYRLDNYIDLSSAWIWIKQMWLETTSPLHVFLVLFAESITEDILSPSPVGHGGGGGGGRGRAREMGHASVRGAQCANEA